MDERAFRRHLLAALAVAVLVRAIALTIPVDPFLNPDSFAFRDLTRSLIERGRLAYVDQGAPGIELVAFRSLLYPIFLAGFVALGTGFAGALVAQAVLGLGTIALVAFIARHAFGNRVATVTAWIGALYWGSLYFERQITSEALFAPHLALAVWLAVRVVNPHGLALPHGMAVPRGLSVPQALAAAHGVPAPRGGVLRAAAGAAFGLTALTRPAGLVAGVALAGHWTLSGLGLRIVLGLLLALSLVLAPALARNHALIGQPAVLTSGGMNFWIGNGRGEVGDAWKIMARTAPTLGERGMDRWFYADTWAHRAEILRRAPRLLADKVYMFVGPFATEGWYLPYRFLLPLVTLGLLWPAARRATDPVASGVLAVVLASQVALALATVAWARYRFPIEPLLWPYAAGSIAELVRRGWRGRLALLGIVVLNGALLAWQMRR